MKREFLRSGVCIFGLSFINWCMWYSGPPLAIITAAAFDSIIYSIIVTIIWLIGRLILLKVSLRGNWCALWLLVVVLGMLGAFQFDKWIMFSDFRERCGLKMGEVRYSGFRQARFLVDGVFQSLESSVCPDLVAFVPVQGNYNESSSLLRFNIRFGTFMASSNVLVGYKSHNTGGGIVIFKIASDHVKYIYSDVR